MITGIIVFLSLAFAGLFTLAYLLRPDLRKQIEKPKFVFQNQIQQYNSRSEQTSDTMASQSDE